MKSTGENEESFPAFDDLFDEDAAQEEGNESPAVEEKVEVKVILKEIGQNSEEWKDAMDKFPSAKMYQERLLDFVQFATDAPDSFSLENCLCIYFKENSRKVNEDGSKTYRGSSLRSWLSVFAKFWLFCKATPDLKRSLPSIENMIRKLELTESSVKRARTFEKDDLLKYYGLEHTLENLVDAP